MNYAGRARSATAISTRGTAAYVADCDDHMVTVIRLKR
jgi:hypothetical protein